MEGTFASWFCYQRDRWELRRQSGMIACHIVDLVWKLSVFVAAHGSCINVAGLVVEELLVTDAFADGSHLKIALQADRQFSAELQACFSKGKSLAA